MSLASYIGINVEIPLSDEDSESLIIIGYCFSDESDRQEVQRNHFTTTFIYEISSDWGIEITKYLHEPMLVESKAKLLALCEMMDSYIQKGECFELYSCWMGDESEKREGEITFQLNNFDIQRIELPEKALVRFEK